jgi:hypothetical protein
MLLFQMVGTLGSIGKQTAIELHTPPDPALHRDESPATDRENLTEWSF